MPGHGTNYRPPKCRRCRRPDTEVYISRRGLCEDCAMAAVAKAAREMAQGEGSNYEKYLESVRSIADRRLGDPGI